MSVMDQNERFIRGLMQYDLTISEINNSGWKYCGGDDAAGKAHVNYFRLIFGVSPEEVPIGKEDSCICGQHIVRNFYICDGKEEEILVLGSECINKFIANNKRICELCNSPHRNRIVNRCNDCRNGLCDKCNKRIDEKYKLCYNCKFN